MKTELWEIVEGQDAIAATAIHDGHGLRADVQKIVALPASDRLREEDPGTGILASIAATQIVARRSRFEVDLNRPREAAVYVFPEDAWGLEVWKSAPPAELVKESLEEYDTFYAEAHRIFSEMESRFGHFVVLDLHSYNHRRGGPGAAPDEPLANPEVNVGTGSLDRQRWGLLVDGFIGDLTAFGFLGRHLDVRENVKFKGGNFSRWVHASFPASACCLAVEFKKFFMDEWSGEFDSREFETISKALSSTLAGLHESLQKMDSE